MFSAHVMGGATRARINVTTFTQFAQNYSMGSLLALYGSTMHSSSSMRFFRTFFYLVCGLLVKKAYLNSNSWGGEDFDGSKVEIWWREILIHTLELKLRHLKVFLYVCIGKPCVFRPRATWATHVYNDLYQICSKLGVWDLEPPSLYGSTMHSSCSMQCKGLQLVTESTSFSNMLLVPKLPCLMHTSTYQLLDCSQSPKLRRVKDWDKRHTRNARLVVGAVKKHHRKSRSPGLDPILYYYAKSKWPHEMSADREVTEAAVKLPSWGHISITRSKSCSF
jgi:hypothetical protein